MHDIAPMAGPIGDYAKIGTIRRIYEKLDAVGVADSLAQMIAEATDDFGTAEFVIESTVIIQDSTEEEIVFHIWMIASIKGRVVEQ